LSEIRHEILLGPLWSESHCSNLAAQHSIEIECGDDQCQMCKRQKTTIRAAAGFLRNLSSFHSGEQYDASAIPRAFAGRRGLGSIQRHQSDVPGAEMEVLLKVGFPRPTPKSTSHSLTSEPMRSG
jgi:hypothetical protein